MLTQVSLNWGTGSVTYPIGGVDPDDPIILKSISGLLPSDITLFTGDYAGNGGYYQGRRIGGRNPVFNFKLNPDYSATSPKSVSSLREQLYTQFYQPTPFQESLLVVLSDDELPDRSMTVYADKQQGDLFSQTTDFQISTQCMDAFLFGPQTSYIAPAGGVTSVPVDYDGSALAGFDSLSIKAVTAGTQFSVDVLGRKMTWVGSILAGDIFTIGTEDGNRYINRTRGGVTTPVLGGLSADSEWLSLGKGVTGTLRTYGNAAGDGKTVITGYAYTTKWWGV